ncbi:MAG: T9SS type A sorting domain-containing protein [Bacteroidia bacterium]
MKIRIFTLSIFISFAFSAFATHIHSGYISFEKIDNSSNEYKITLTTYTESRSVAAHRDEHQINLGYKTNGQDATMILNGIQTQLLVVENIWKNVYSGTHKFPSSQETFDLVVTDNNMSQGVLNVNSKSSVNVPFRLSTTLNINDNLHSPVFDSILTVFTSPGQFVNFNGGIKDADGDRVEYELIPEDIDYSFPSSIGNGNQVFKTSSTNLIWNRPKRQGMFLAKVKVLEYEKNSSKVLSETNVYVMIFSISSTDIKEAKSDKFISQYQNGFLYSGNGNPNRLVIYNLCGQAVVSKSNLKSSETIEYPIQSGVYIIQFKEGKHEQTFKVSIR